MRAAYLVEDVSVTGGPLPTGGVWTIRGGGFGNLTGDARCRLSPVGNASSVGGCDRALIAPATVVSATTLTCETGQLYDAASGAAASACATVYDVALLPNGGAGDGLAAPTLEGDPTFLMYDPSTVTLSRASPAAVPVGAAASLVVHGGVFRDFGAGQLVCQIGGDPAQPATLLDASRVLCTLRASSVPAPGASVSVQVSLNGASAGSFAANSVSVAVFAPPTLDAVAPTEGVALGGETVMLHGSGFDALAGTAAAADLACRFGGVLSPSATLLNGTHVACVTPYGLESDDGSVVEISLNGQSFVGGGAAGSGVRFRFKGLHKPEIVAARFSPDGDRLYFHFDAQPTNRAGFNGLFDCALLLTPPSVARVRGSSPSAAMCDWLDDVTLTAQLSTYSTLLPGDALGIRERMLWPRGAPGCETADGDLCANTSATISTDHPCDAPSSDDVERCVVPTAVIQAPLSISKCDDARLTLDGSFSTGGGTRSLSFLWGVHPTESDAATRIGASLTAVRTTNPAASVVELSEALVGGQDFLFLLRVTNFLGQTSVQVTHRVERLRDQRPTIFIDAPPSLVVRRSGSIELFARAQVATCANSNANVEFAWRAHAIGSGDPLALEPAAAARAAYTLRGMTLDARLGYSYRFTVSGCLSGQCGEAYADVALKNEPLIAKISGGDRRVGQDSAVEVQLLSFAGRLKPGTYCPIPPLHSKPPAPIPPPTAPLPSCVCRTGECSRVDRP